MYTENEHRGGYIWHRQCEALCVQSDTHINNALIGRTDDVIMI